MALDWVQNALRQALGFFPYPATFNLRVESENELDVWRQVKSGAKGVDIQSPDASYCEARCFPVKIQGSYTGVVLLPTIQGYPEDKIEVIAPFRLKDHLGVRDGDEVTLEFLT